MKTKFSVRGMSCSACSLGIEKNLAMQDGIVSVSVSLMGQSMVVSYDSNMITMQQICDQVTHLGYRTTLYTGEVEVAKHFDWVLARFGVSLVLLLGIMYLCMGGMVDLPQPSDTISYSVQLALTVVVLALNHKFFVMGTRAVLHRAANMDTLVALSSGASFVYSLVMTIKFYCGTPLDGHLYYESAAMVVTLVTLGKWLEDKSKRKTSREIERLSKIIPKTVTILVDGQEKVVETNQLQLEDTIVLRQGDYIPIDGIVVDGFAFVDKSAITGESMSVEVTHEDRVVSGSIMKSGYLLVEAERVGDDTLFSKIIESVRTAGESKAPIQKFVDKVAGVFVPVVSLLAIITLGVWWLVSRDFYTAFNYGISVLVISCPCALGLATPVAIMAATGKGASLGILYKDAEAIQKSHQIDCVILDKTATITRGEPRVVDAQYFVDRDMVNKIVSAIEGNSNHPLAECIKQYVGPSTFECKDYQYIVGQGIIANIGSTQYRMGNSSLVAGVDNKRCEQMLNKYDTAGKTTIFLASNVAILAVFAIADTVKTHSKLAIEHLKNHNVLTVMATGDNKGAAAEIARQVGIQQYIAEVMPSDKVDAVTKYQTEGYHVSMVGDGINDSPAIKGSDLGIAMGTGTDVAIDSADVVIASGSLRGVCDTIALGKKTVKIIKGNLFWAFLYNVIAIPIAAGAFASLGLSLTPSISAGCMCLSSLFVVTNALRITGYKSQFDPARMPKEDSAPSCQCDTDAIVTNLTVTGMMCEHCVKHVTDALMALEGVTNVDIVLADKSVAISSTVELDHQTVVDAITTAGYKVI